MTVSLDLVLVAAGAVLLCAAVAWRWRGRALRRDQVRARLKAALADPDPAVRKAAVAVSAQRGLSELAELLLDASARERDEEVLDAIAEAVARNQWEPLDDPVLLELRLWARRRFEERRLPRVVPAQAGPEGARGRDRVVPFERRRARGDGGE
jgi:hypothetical protein